LVGYLIWTEGKFKPPTIFASQKVAGLA